MVTRGLVADDSQPRLGNKMMDLSEDERDWDLDQDGLLNSLTFGWMEDGRLGYPPDISSYLQISPRPVAALRTPMNTRTKMQFACRRASAGSRHTIFLMFNYRSEPDKGRKKTKKLYLAGLNQLALCEEPGFTAPDEVEWDVDEEPKYVVAGRGNTFIITEDGNVYSFGNCLYGVLGHCEERSSQVPRQVLALRKLRVQQIAVGGHHVVALTDTQRLFSWGRNDMGQLGRGFESRMEVVPAAIEYFDPKTERLLQVSAGMHHTILLVAFTGLRKESGEEMKLYSWGDGSRGQLGSANVERRCHPQENVWIGKYLKRNSFTVLSIAAGGWHNLLLTNYSRHVISWGAGDYGQLGQGQAWDAARPGMASGLRGVVKIAAGLRHSFAVVEKGTSELWAWGYNGYGELGLGDCDMRIQPTKLTAFRDTTVIDISCGDRHTVVVTSHKPMKIRESPLLRPFFSILQASSGTSAIRSVKRMMYKRGFDPALIDSPDAPVPNQTGLTDEPLKNDKYERGLRYCMDTFVDPSDWRRKTYETAFECFVAKKHLKSVCLACSRQCMARQRLRAYIRRREPGDHCDCRTSGLCVCAWSRVRGEFDKVAGPDGCIGPNQFRSLLTTLRAPELIEKEDVDDCLACFTEDSIEASDQPRVAGKGFESWYREYYDEQDENESSDDGDGKAGGQIIKSKRKDSTVNSKAKSLSPSKKPVDNKKSAANKTKKSKATTSKTNKGK